MNGPHGNRARLGGVLLAAVAALAILALPGLASGHRQHDPPGDAGTINSFDPETGVLTIDLANGGSVSGLVVRRTRIRCGHPRRHRHGRRHGLRHKRRHLAKASRRGRDGGEHEIENESGDDRGDRHGGDDDPAGHDGTAPGRSEGPGQGADHSARCGSDDLVAGATVKVAELVLINGNAYYKLVGLPKQAPAGEPEGEGGDDEGGEPEPIG